MQQNGVISRFEAWTEYVKRVKYLKLFFRRLIQSPHFNAWVEYTRLKKLIKKLDKNAIVIQAFGRCLISKLRFRLSRKSATVLKYFGLIVLAMKEARHRRAKAISKGFEKWKPLEEARALERDEESERRRLQTEQQVIRLQIDSSVSKLSQI